jgi:hypothetical protein
VSARHVSPQHNPVAHNRRVAALYGAIIGLVLAACIWLAIACDCTARQTGAIALAGFLVASVVVGTVTR